jgi:tRNA(fMet)-specific endonuclease VapC
VTFLDTSVIIDFLAGEKRIVALVHEIAMKEDVKTTTITEYELLRYKNKIKKRAVERFLSATVVHSFDRAAAKEAALLYEELNNAGRMINENDLLIAGIVLANDEDLLTRDQKFGSIGKDNFRMV